MRNYYLIARDRKSNSFNIVNIKEKWYLNDENNNTHIACRLEEIDLVTSQFFSRSQLADRLYKIGVIDNTDVDIFIACKKVKDGKEYIRFDEVIYNPYRNRRMANFRDVAFNFLRDRSINTNESENEIYDELIMTLYAASDLFSIVMEGGSSLSKSFVNKLRDILKYEEVPLDLKYDKYFRASDYRSFRNIVETLNRFELISRCSREDRWLANQAFVEENESDRMAIVDKLALILKRSISPEQMVISSFADESVRSATKEIVKSKRKELETDFLQFQKPVVVNEHVSQKEKKSVINQVLDKLSLKAFKRSGNNYSVNYDLFSYPLFEEEKRQLDTLLTGNLPKYIANYTLHHHRYLEAQKCGISDSEILEFRSIMSRDMASINARLKRSKCVDDTYRWCVIYDECMKRCSDYESDDNNAFGGKTYGKHQ